MACRGTDGTFRRVPLRLVASAVIAGALLAGLALAPTARAAEPKKPTSSCVACHTDAQKLQAESAGIPQPAGSALQSGKG